MNQQAAQTNYDAFINKLKEIKHGTRGWVSFSKAECAKMGCSQNSALIVVKAMGLKFDVHGRHGYTAFK